MDELRLAQRAVRRRLLSEEQLREAQGFASGGRSLLSVLLDLGYLNASDVAELTRPASSPAAGPDAASRQKMPRWVVVASLGAVALVFGTAILSSRRPAGPPLVRPGSPPATPEQLAGAILGNCEQAVKAEGKVSSSTRELLERAIELYGKGSSTEDSQYGIGRARELLGDHPEALQCYVRVVSWNPRHYSALLGASRLSLKKGDAQAASEYARLALSLPDGKTADAYFLKGRAELRLGATDAAWKDLEEARRQDPALGPAIDALR